MKACPLPRAHQVSAHLHDKSDLEHLFMALVICVIEITLTLGVEVIAVHLLLALAVCGRETAQILLSAGTGGPR